MPLLSKACSAAAVLSIILQTTSGVFAHDGAFPAPGFDTSSDVFVAPAPQEAPMFDDTMQFEGEDSSVDVAGEGFADTAPAEEEVDITTFQPAAQYDDYTEDVPISPFEKGMGCQSYDPVSVDWQAVRDDIVGYLSQGGGNIGPDGVKYARVAPMLVRGAFHDAGARKNGRGGADGSAVLSGKEQDWLANTFPLKFMPYIRGALWPVVDKYQISWADAMAVAGVAGAQFLGAPNGFSLKVGRCDSSKENPDDAMPPPTVDYTTFVEYWSSVGISVRQAAALMGSHSAIESHHAGGTPVEWSNVMFRSMTKGEITVTDAEGLEGAESVHWSSGEWKFTVNDANNAPQNIAKGCPFASQFIAAVRTYASSDNIWFTDFARAYKRMTEIGAEWAPSTTVVRL